MPRKIKNVKTATDKEISKRAWLNPYKFKPGQSGNLCGRPKKKPITDRYAEQLEEPVPEEVRLQLGLPPAATMGDAIARRMAIRAIEGRDAVNAAKEMREAIEGKAPQAVDVNETRDIVMHVTYGNLNDGPDRDELT